jgi:hypothetical protein
MKGYNELRLCKDVLIEALQEYFDKRAHNGRAEFAVRIVRPFEEVFIVSTFERPRVDTEVKGAVASGSYKSLSIEGDGEVSGSYKPIRGDVP